MVAVFAAWKILYGSANISSHRQKKQAMRDSYTLSFRANFTQIGQFLAAQNRVEILVQPRGSSFSILKLQSLTVTDDEYMVHGILFPPK